ncbi:MAG: hypothetical protein QOK17_2740 [Sphingomonadales bacterium]|jgi:hypothetical protein|nr:hypothetical protein [Sphingomonadales bacterium]
MNRLAPLVARAPARSATARAWAVDPSQPKLEGWDELCLFAAAFAGGLVFFATLFA